MLIAFFAALTSLGAMMIFGTCSVYGQNYPTKPIRLVTQEPGGPADFASRLIAQELSGPLGQQIIVDNRPSGVIPGEIVSQAPPDGYTLLVSGGPLWITPLLQKTPYDPVKDFLPISILGSSPNILVVSPSLPVKSVKELIALAKAKPGELSNGSFSIGGGTHLASELFKVMAGVNIVAVNYKGTGPAIIDLLADRVQLIFLPPAAVLPQIKAGKLRALAVTSAEPSALAPGLPTVASSGLPGYEAAVVLGLFAPAKTPGATITRLNQEVVRVLNLSDVKQKFFNVGVESGGSSPEQLGATIKSEMVVWGKLIKDAGIRAQ